MKKHLEIVNFSTDINFTQLEALLSESNIQEIKKTNLEHLNSNPSSENRFPLRPRTGLLIFVQLNSTDGRRWKVEIPKLVPVWLLYFSQSSDLYSQSLLMMFQLLHSSFMFHNCTHYLASLLNWYDTDTGDIHGCAQRPNERFKSLTALKKYHPPQNCIK